MRFVKKEYRELTVEIKEVHEKLFFIKLKGRITLKGASLILEDVIKVSNNEKIIAIFDLLEIESITPKTMRTYLKTIDTNIIYRIYINIPNLYKYKMVNILENIDELIIKDNYQDAIDFGLSILSNNIMKKRWNYSYENFSFNIKYISENILYIKYFGSANYKETSFFLEKLLKIIENKKRLVVIQDTKELNYNTLRSRNLVIKTLGNDSRFLGSIYIGLSELQKFKLKTVGLHLIKIPLLISDSYDDALDKANKLLEKKHNNDNNNNNIVSSKENQILNHIFYNMNKKFIKKINKYIIFINKYMENNENDENDMNWSNNPFSILFNSFSIMISDIKELILNLNAKQKELLYTQNELNKRKNLLEKKVEERKRRLEDINSKLIKEIREKKTNENKIKKSKDIAQRDNMTKTLFLSNISDKLKLSIEKIDKDIKKIQNSKYIDRTKIKLDLEKIIKLSEQLSIDILDLITYSQIESGKIDYKIEKYNFSKIAKEVIGTFNYLAIEKNIKIIVTDETNNKNINMDGYQITEVISNLLSNAIKYSFKDSKIFIDIKIIKDKLIFSIKDLGVGILPNKITSIFEDFTTNVGLIISKKIILHHKGDIWVKNNKNKGVTFIFTLPL